ncbi:hypothetical protein DXG01_011225 [Tephrocybe rancida]|nr:hypothetical protein DXG01_011225 [Tephrocybe rancida]
MSQVKLILRPPPNVDFVHGYPGIPPAGPDRPQALVKGNVEVRVGPQGAKTKWVRIELRKVETLPGGGLSNTFYDFVGPSPINLWQSSDEYSLLRSLDFPFSIRIPESIPPTIALANGAGIQYELVASLCTKGKRGFFRKRKSAVVSTKANIIIDKHDLHSSWPVYCQPETRQVIQNGATLIVDRNQTCFGPGDRISVMALLKSDTLTDTVLRGFELTLKEITIFHPGAQPGRKAAAPQERLVTICDSKLAINGALYPGHEHRAELTCAISQNHTTTSLNSARHIDVTYILSVKAIVDNIAPIVMDLPVIVSNWQRVVSQEAIRRIGPTPGLSLGPVQPITQAVIRAEPSRPSPAAATLPLSKDNYLHETPANNFSSLPAKTGAGYYGSAKVDEIGGYGFSTKSKPESITSSTDDYVANLPVSNATSPARGLGSANATSPAKRLTVANLPAETPQPEADPRQRVGSNGATGATANRAWMTAEDEKKRLYEIARAKVERTQNGSTRTTTPPPQRAASPPAQSPQPAPAPTASPKTWLTAEEEKTRLFHKAQAAVLKKAQGLDNSPPASLHGRSDSDGGRGADLSRQASTSKTPPPIKKQFTAAELYSEAMAARNQAMARQQSAHALPQQQTPPRAPVPQYRTAEEEKAALKRYHEAKQAVSRLQNGDEPAEDAGSLQLGSAPVAYEALYPDTKGGSSSTPAPAPASDLPPPFEMPANVIPASHLSEKERVRRAYEEQDAAALARQLSANTSPPPFSQQAPAIGPNGISNALSEKELLRRKFEAQDAQAMNPAPDYTAAPTPPPRSNPASTTASRSPSVAARGPRPVPAMPSSPGKILTAAEEKALLRAQYAAQDARAKQQQQQQQQQQQPRENGTGSSRPPSSAILPTSTPPPPPPLMPRPPVEYIQETQAEDARVSRFAVTGIIPTDDALLHTMPLKVQNGATPPLDMQPFSPFVAGFEHSIPKPPPLPPKPAE